MRILLPSTHTTARDWLARAVPLRDCASCGDTIPTYGPIVCDPCMDLGFCSCCGLEHRPTACPQVVEARLHMAAADAHTLRVIAALNEQL